MKKTITKTPLEHDDLPTLMVSIDCIQVVSNNRRRFDEKKLKELADNIAKVGVLLPLLVRGDMPNEYQLVAGERRLRAAKMAGLLEVPVRVGPWTEQEATEIQAFENLHREDLTPTEEARAFKAVLENGGHDVESLAQRVDKSETYVYRALALLNLPESILSEIEEGTITPAHGHQLLRLPAEEREKAFTEWRNSWDAKDNGFSIKSLKDSLESVELTRDLDRAIFPKDKPYAEFQSCASCPCNSGNQGNLFDGAEKGTCTNATCFDAKTDQARKDVASKAMAKQFKGIAFAGVVERDYRGIQFKGGVAVNADMLADKKFADLVQEKPAKFCFVVAKESPHDKDRRKPEAVLVCKDPALLRKIAPKAEAKQKAFDSSTGGFKKTAREKFIEAETEKALCEEAAGVVNINAHCTQGDAFWKLVIHAMAGHSSPQYIWSRLGISDDSEEKKLWQMDPLRWYETALLLAVNPYGRVNRDALKALGIKVGDVVKAAQSAAGKAYDAKKSAKKGGSKKGATDANETEQA